MEQRSSSALSSENYFYMRMDGHEIIWANTMAKLCVQIWNAYQITVYINLLAPEFGI